MTGLPRLPWVNVNWLIRAGALRIVLLTDATLNEFLQAYVKLSV